MKFKLNQSSFLFALIIIAIFISGCSNQSQVKPDNVDANIKMYTHVWDEIINKRRLDMFNDSNFTKNLVMHEGTEDVNGIDSAKEYYSNFLTGFSNISFTIKDVFGHGDKIVKYWNFKGKHTGVFFGINSTNKNVEIEGATLVRMENGKIAEERDFIDNLELIQQLGGTCSFEETIVK